ncbi:hypothetical protein I3760_07G041500 [Carya illinoinensis]|nr:hypothetical protein I3760_07G041500 [Carya illinoinensis]
MKAVSAILERRIPGALLPIIVYTLLASRISVTQSVNPLLRRTPPSLLSTKRFPKSSPCHLCSSSFFCLPALRRPTCTAPWLSHSCSSLSSLPMAATSAVESPIEANPLLLDFEFPPFDVVEAKHEDDLVELERQVEPSWPKLVEPLEKIVDRLTVVWGIVNHLKAVKDSPELRSAIEEVQPEKVKFQLRLGQSKAIYNAFKAIQESPGWQSLSDARKRIVESQLKEAILSGVSLEDDERDQFNKIEQELQRLSQKFDENVLDATKKFEKLIMDKKEIEGLPATALGMAAQTAVSKGYENATAENGPWIITLDGPSFMSTMQHARNRSLREEVYRAYVTRASNGDLDNTAIIEQILKLRLEKAKLLNYNNYAEVLSMATKMATVEKAEELLETLRSASWNASVQGGALYIVYTWL